MEYGVVAIPLNRPEIVSFLLPPPPEPRGAALTILGQRPSLAAQRQWVDHLRRTAQPAVADLLRIDHPHAYFYRSHTDRLVPAQFLREEGFLTRNLGGWTAIYFGVMGLPEAATTDPLWRNAHVLAAHGETVRAFGADAAMVEARLEAETGDGATAVARAFIHLHNQRPQTDPPMLPEMVRYIERVYAEVAAGSGFGGAEGVSVPRPLLLDELMGWLVALELRRRRADAAGDAATVAAIDAWFADQADETGLIFILKGEYIVGRHRRSTVLIAPELGVVIKQPGPEPFHEIALGAKEWKGKAENWPVLTHDESLVTPHGRIRQVLEEGLIPRLHEVLDHPMDFYTLLGITVEPFVVGPTTQELVLADPAALTPDLYETYVLHQQAAEALGVENGDWHSANFVVRDGDGAIVHIDWGAARPLRPDEHTPDQQRVRFDQVQNIAYSFHDEALAERVLQLHADLAADKTRLDRLRTRAEGLVG